jgi:outer membrane lipoprotein-sorting protein
MNPADDIRRLFKKAELSIQPDADEQVFQDVLRARQKTKENSTLRWSRWRMTMRNPITKLAAAAIIAVACIAGIVVWTGTGSGIALANVLAQVQQITAYMYQMTITVNGKAPSGQAINQNIEGTVLIAQAYGMKMTMDTPDPNGGKAQRTETYMLPQEKAMIWLMPATKQYMRMELDDTLIEKTRQQNYDPGSMLKQILNCKYESLGRSVVDGVEVEGFQMTDPNYLAGMMGQVDVKIWVDVKTQLPVRVEMDKQMGDMQMHTVVHNFQWDYPVNAETFKPVIPADYAALSGGPMKMPAMNEEGAIAGLKMFADLFGRYPEKLDFVSLMSQMGKNLMLEKDKLKDSDNPAAKQIFEGSKDLSQEEITKKVMDIMMPIQGAGMFYMMLTQEKKDPAYYGNLVTPQDADKVLLRWKVSDNQYRVIFGSLHAETVSAEVLAELEKGLPK